MSWEDWDQRQRDRWVAEFRAGQHDPECEQRERFHICQCDFRRRQKEGPLDAPTLWHSYPTCSHCHQEVSHDGDSFVCSRCHVSWSSNAGEDEPGTFYDDHRYPDGGLYSKVEPEHWGDRLVEVVL